MKRFVCCALAALVLAVPGLVLADKGDDDKKNDDKFRTVTAGEFDPQHTFLVQGQWIRGLGCPTGARTAACHPSDPDCNRTVPGPSYTDPACPTGDEKDRRNEGLLLSKIGPTSNVAAAGADLRNVRGITLTELGYDIRKAGPTVADDRGSHCGAGAPRFNVATTTGFFFVGCNSPVPDSQTDGDGYIRLRWGAGGTVQGFNAATGALGPITGTVRSIMLVFDEGTDTGPDNFGLAVLDNIDVNGTLVGRGNDD